MDLNINQKIEEIKNKLTELYKQNKIIHVSIIAGRKKIKSAPTKILGAYTNFICVESEVNKYMESFTINYRDIMIKKIVIDELGN
jgi:uncharacterized protein Veg